MNDFNVGQNLLCFGPCCMIFVFSVSICCLTCCMFCLIALLISLICDLMLSVLCFCCCFRRCFLVLISLSVSAGSRGR